MMLGEDDYFTDNNTRGLSEALRRSEQPKGTGNDSFSYKAPVQPKYSPAAAAAPAASPVRPSVLHFVQCAGYKYVGNQPNDIGTVGAAIVAAKGATTAQVIVYKKPTEYLCTAEITKDFRYTVAADRFASFYGNDRTPWSLRFNSAEDERMFAIHVALAKFHVSGMNTPVSLDMPSQKTATARPISTGDSVGLKYTAWLLADNGSCGKMVDSNADKEGAFFKITVGDHGGVLLGWHDALIDMHKGDRKILVLPASLAYGEAGVPPTIPAGSPIIFDISVGKYKHGGAPQTAPSSPAPAGVALSSSVRVEPTSTAVVPIAAAPEPAPAQTYVQPQQQQQQQQPQMQQLVIAPAPQMQQTQQMYQQPQVMGQMGVPLQPTYQTYANAMQGGVSSADTISMMMEDRQFRSDVKQALGTFQNRLDSMHQMLQELKQPCGSDGSPDSVDISGMMIISTIQRLVDKNERCKLEEQDRNQTIMSLTQKCKDLEDSNQRYVEESSKMIAMRDDAHRKELEQMRLQLDAAGREKSRVENELAQAQLFMDSARQQANVLQEQVNAQQSEIASLRADGAAVAEALRGAQEKINLTEARVAAERENVLAEQKAKEQLSSALDAQKRQTDALTEALANSEKLAAAQKARNAAEVTQMKKEHQDEVDGLQAQVLKLQKQIGKLEASMPNAVQIEAEAEKKWRKKADLMVEEARVVLDQSYKDKLDDMSKKVKEARKEKDEMEERLEEAEARMKAAEKAAERLAKEAKDSGVPVVINMGEGKKTTKKVIKKVIGLSEEKVRARIEEIKQRDNEQLSESVKKAMNSVFHFLKENIDAEQSYDGKAVLLAIKKSIKKTTLEFLKELEELAANGPDDMEGLAPEKQEEEEEEEEEEEVEEEEDNKEPELPKKEEEKVPEDIKDEDEEEQKKPEPEPEVEPEPAVEPEAEPEAEPEPEPEAKPEPEEVLEEKTEENKEEEFVSEEEEEKKPEPEAEPEPEKEEEKPAPLFDDDELPEPSTKTEEKPAEEKPAEEPKKSAPLFGDDDEEDDFLGTVSKTANAAPVAAELPESLPAVDSEPAAAAEEEDPLGSGAPPPPLPTNNKPLFSEADEEFGGDIGAAAMAGDQKAASKLFEDDDGDEW